MTATDEQKQLKEKLIEVPIKLRQAQGRDFKTEVFKREGDMVTKENAPRIGQPYWLRSTIEGRVDNKPYLISEETNWEELREYLKLGMVYIPISDIDL